MFAKPFSLVLVYVVTIFNVVVLASPVLASLIPFIQLKHNSIIIENELYLKVKLVFFILCFLVSFLMLLYLLLDFLFGFSVRASLKGCVRYEKIKDYDFLTDLFGQVKNKFGEKSVKLYIKN